MTQDKQSSPCNSDKFVFIDALRGFDMFWIIGGGTVFANFAEVWDNPVTRTNELAKLLER